MRATRRSWTVAAAMLVLVAFACGRDGDEAGAEDGITVFAAASLTDAFSEVGTAFSDAHPDVSVTFSFDASSSLVRQIVEGAPVDVFASADPANMATLTAAGLDAAEPEIFATNRMAIVVAAGNPRRITGVTDLSDVGLDVVVCAPQVPCGGYARQLFASAGVTVTPDSFEPNVRGVVTKVTAGEADAGVVYVTDARAAGDAAAVVEIPDGRNVVAHYPVAVVADAPHPDGARAFVDFLTGPRGQAVLAGHGFGPP